MKNPFRHLQPTDARRAELRANALAALFPDRVPHDDDDTRFFELYKLMVASSEALVARRQGVNTFFLTANGLLLTGLGLILKGGGHQRLHSAAIFVFVITGLFLTLAWRSLLISFGQLNTGKFIVINSMESHLPAAIYAAEWKALGEGNDKSVYRSFTARETWVPTALGAVYVIAATLSFLVWVGVWHPGK